MEALIVVDLTKDNVDHSRFYSGVVDKERIRELVGAFKKRGAPVIFACDSFYKEDFLFKGGMRPHNIRGTTGCEPADGIGYEKGDMVVYKPRFSAFFKTDLDLYLRQRDVVRVYVCGINTNVCVLATLYDALCHGFEAYLVKDLSWSNKERFHKTVVEMIETSILGEIAGTIESDTLLCQ